MRAVILTILFLLFSGTWHLAEAQVNPARQCKILIKKRQGKFKYRSAKRYRKIKKSSRDQDFRLAETGAEVAQNKAKKSKKRKKSEAVASTGANVIIFNSMQMPSDDERDSIRKKVSEQLAQKEDGAPLRIDPLLFTDNNGQLEIKDMQPFLTAVEFGLQGRIVIIDGYLGASSAVERMERVKSLMVNMGVKENLVSITGNHPLARTNSVPRIEFTVF